MCMLQGGHALFHILCTYIADKGVHYMAMAQIFILYIYQKWPHVTVWEWTVLFSPHLEWRVYLRLYLHIYSRLLELRGVYLLMHMHTLIILYMWWVCVHVYMCVHVLMFCACLPPNVPSGHGEQRTRRCVHVFCPPVLHATWIEDGYDWIQYSSCCQSLQWKIQFQCLAYNKTLDYCVLYITCML